MGMQLPDWARSLFLIATGDGWPEADEDLLWELSREWVSVAGAVYELEIRITEPVRAVRRTNWDGPASEAFAASADSFGEQGRHQLAGLAAGSQKLADFIHETGVNVQYMKIITIEQLVILAAQIAYMMAMSPWSFGTSTAMVPALKLFGRLFAQSALRQLIISILSGQVLQVALDAIDQSLQMALGARKHWNVSLTKNAAITGAVGTALGPLMHGAGSLAGKKLEQLLGNRVAKGLETIGTNAAHEYTTSGFTGVVTGQGWTGSPWDLTAGGIEGALDAGGNLLRHRRGHGAGPHVPSIELSEINPDRVTIEDHRIEDHRPGSLPLLPVPGPTDTSSAAGDNHTTPIPVEQLNSTVLGPPSTQTPNAENPGNSDGAPLPPSRLGRYGRLSASDVVIGWYPDDVLPWRVLADQVAPRIGSAWDHLGPVLRTFLTSATVRAQLTSVTRGDQWVIEVDRGGWRGSVSLDAVVDGVAWDRDIDKFEFEGGADSHGALGGGHDVRWRVGGGPSLMVKALGGEFAVGFKGHQDAQRGSTASLGGRTVGRSKTVEPASIWNGRMTVRIGIDLTSVGGQRISLSDVRVETGIRVATPKADSPGEAGRVPPPAQHYAPPVRVQTDGRLGSTDIVLDIYSPSTRPVEDADATSVHARGGGIRPVLDQLDEPGRRVFGGDWPAVKRELLAKVRFATLHQHLKSMMSGQPVSIPLTSLAGQVDITARATEMRHVRSTPQTEFNVGAEVRQAVDVLRARSSTAEVAASGLFKEKAIAPAQLRIGGLVQVGADWERQVGAVSRSGTAIKTKAPGEVFDGVALLRFAFRRDALTGTVQADFGAPVAFQTVVERTEAVPTAAPTRWRLGEPVVEPVPSYLDHGGEDSAATPIPVWGGDALPDTAVVSDLAEVDKIHAAIDEAGGEFFGRRSWSDIRTLILDGFHANLLTAMLPSMTRGHVFEGPYLNNWGLPAGSRVSATAKLVAMRHRRTVSSQLATTNERTVRRGTQRAGWWSGQMIAGGGAATPAPGGLRALGDVGGETRRSSGVESSSAGTTVSNAKIPMDVAVFGGVLEVSITFADRRRSLFRRAQVPVEITVPARGALAQPIGVFGDVAPTRVLLPPDRLRIEGRLGASDVVTELRGCPSVVTDAVAAHVGDRLGTAWRAVHSEVRSRFDLFTLRSNLAALTTGDAVEVPVSGFGWSGRIRLRGRIDALAHRETIRGTEFEAGTENGTMIGTRNDARTRGIISATLTGRAPHVKITGTLGHYRDQGRSTIAKSGGRLVATSKTVENAAVFDGTVRFTADFTLRRLGVPVRVDDLHVDVPAQFLVRERDSVVAGWPVPAAPAPKPDERVPPPQRVLDTMRLNSSDVVLDVAPPTPRHRHVSGGMAEIFSAVDTRGQAIFGRSWPAARAAVLAELDLARLKQELGTMMAGQPIVVKIPHGQVLITARLLEIEHANSTEKTEFNSGTQRRTTIILSERDTGSAQVAADRDGGIAAVATGSVLATTDPIGVSPIAIVAGVTGTLSVGNQTTRVRSLAGTVAMTTKAKEAGAVFVGSMLLNVRLERNTPFGPPRVAMAFAPARFTALIRGSEAVPVPPPGQLPQSVWAPPPRVWSPTPGEGLRDTDVVHGLADTGGIIQAVDAYGRSLFGASTWKRISSIVFDTVGNVQLATHLPSMTRGEALVSPPLLTGPTDPPANVTVTAQIVQLRYVREDNNAELNPVNETRDRETYGRQHWSGGGAQAQAGAEAQLPGLSLIGTLNAGVQRRGRNTVGEMLTGRVVDNGKFAEPVARCEGYVKFTTTLRKGDQVRTFVGLAPVELSIPVNDSAATR